MTPYKFEMTTDEMRARRAAKWTMFGDTVIPAWVAEMDFRPAPVVHKAITRIVDQQDYGYPWRDRQPAGDSVAKAFATHMAEVFDWTIDAKQVVPLADLIQGTYAPIMAFTKPGDGIVLPMPSYPPFQEAIQSTGRRMIETQLVLENGRYTLDFDALERQTDKTTSMFVLCNPQNPTGGVFTREELLRIGDYAIRHDLIILSDEIHGDLVYPGQRHIPIASLSPEIAARTVTLNSATKSFNIPGLRCAVIHFGTPELMKRFTDILPLKMMGQPGIIGIDATVAAWTEGREWLLSTLDHLTKVRDHVVRRLADELPGISYAVPEATYMIWLDCAGLELGMPAGKFFLEQAGIAFSAGETFDKASGHCVRFNFATSMEIADTIIDRMVEAVRKSNQAAKVAE